MEGEATFEILPCSFDIEDSITNKSMQLKNLYIPVLIKINIIHLKHLNNKCQQKFYNIITPFRDSTTFSLSSSSTGISMTSSVSSS